MAKRKYPDIQLKEVRKPAGYGSLVAVLDLEDDIRELWFQHDQNPDVIRVLRLDLASGVTSSSQYIDARGRRER